MAEVIVKVEHGAGLHARPLAKFVKTAKEFDAGVEVTNLTRGKGPVNGASPVKLLLLAVLQGHEIKIETSGPEADVAATALKELVESNFGE